MQLFVAAMMASLSEEVAAKDREIVSLRSTLPIAKAMRPDSSTSTPDSG